MRPTHRMPVLLLLLFSWLAAVAAPAWALDLVAGGDRFCLRDAEGAKCWTKGQSAIRFLPLAEGRALFAGTRRVCALDGDALTCWRGHDDTPVVRTGMQAVADVAVGDHHTCVLRAGGTQECWLEDSASPWRITDVAPPPTFADYGEYRIARMVGGQGATCAVYHRFPTLADVRCWARHDRRMRMPCGECTFHSFSFVDIAMAGPLLCYLHTTRETSRVTCLRFGVHDPNRQTVERYQDVELVLPLEPAPRRIAASARYTCWTDSAKGTTCMASVTEAGPAETTRPVPALAGAERIAIADDVACALVGTELRCANLATGATIAAPAAVVEPALHRFDAGSLAGDFDELSALVYRDRAVFLASAAAVARENAVADAARGKPLAFFVMTLAAPVIESVTTSFFERHVTPRYTAALARANAAHGISGLADFPDDPARRRATLAMLAAALRAAADAAAVPETRRELDELLAATARALARGAEPADVAAVGAALVGAGPRLEALEASPATRGYAVVIDEVAGLIGGR